MRRILIRLAGVAICAAMVYGYARYSVISKASESVTRAQQALVQGDFQDARQQLKWLLWFQPDRADALLVVGNTWLKEKNPAQAVEYFKRVPVNSEKHRSASLAAAFAWLNAGFLGSCEEIFRQHLLRYPDSDVAYEELKWLYFNQFRLRELERFFDEQLVLSPGNYKVLLDALNTEIREQVAQEAVVALRKANEAQPDQAVVLLALGYCHWQLGDLKTAREQLQRAWQLRPDHPETRLTVAEFLIEQDQLQAAREMLLADEPDSHPLRSEFQKHDLWHWLRHRIAVIEDDSEDAMRHLNAALQLRPFDLQYLQTRGSLLQTLGKSTEAAQVFQEINPRASAEQRLLQVVLTENLDAPTVEVCREIAELYEIRGRHNLASGWRMNADRLAAAASSAGIAR
jgi:tetratricopeptide (TPR) repeat protein